MTHLTTAVVICAYTMDRWDDLCSSVTSAVVQSPPPDEVIVVVDHNPTLLARVKGELQPHQPLLNVLSNSRQQGLSGARNTALVNVSSEIVVFLDDDASAEAGWLRRLACHYTDPLVIAVGGAAVPNWPSGRRRPVTLPTSALAASGELDWVVGCTYSGQPTTATPVRNLMGCNMSFRRQVFEQVGGFSEALGRVGTTPLGCEETELCIRAQESFPNSRIIFEPLALVHHQVSLNRLTWRYLRHRCYAEGLSKAAVSRMVGANKALSTERTYASKILPRAVARELTRPGSGASRTDGFRSAAAIALALAATAFGYARGRGTSKTKLEQDGPRLPIAGSQSA